MNQLKINNFFPQKVKKMSGASSWSGDLCACAASCMTGLPSPHQHTSSSDGANSAFHSDRILSHMLSLSLPTAILRPSDSTSRSRSRSHLCTSHQVPSCMASMLSPESPAAVGSHLLMQMKLLPNPSKFALLECLPVKS